MPCGITRLAPMDQTPSIKAYPNAKCSSDCRTCSRRSASLSALRLGAGSNSLPGSFRAQILPQQPTVTCRQSLPKLHRICRYAQMSPAVSVLHAMSSGACSVSETLSRGITLRTAQIPAVRVLLNSNWALCMQYVVHFPKGEKYVSLLRNAEDTEAQRALEAERARIRAKVQQQLADEAMITQADEGRPQSLLQPATEQAARKAQQVHICPSYVISRCPHMKGPSYVISHCPHMRAVKALFLNMSKIMMR